MDSRTGIASADIAGIVVSEVSISDVSISDVASSTFLQIPAPDIARYRSVLRCRICGYWRLSKECVKPLHVLQEALMGTEPFQVHNEPDHIGVMVVDGVVRVDGLYGVEADSDGRSPPIIRPSRWFDEPERLAIDPAG